MEPKYEAARVFTDGLAAVKQDGLWGYINTEGQYVLPPQYEDAFLFSDQVAAVKKGGKWGFINRSGKFLIEPKYDDAAIFRQGLAAVKWEGRWGFVDKTGEMVIPPRWEQVYFFQDNRCGVRVDGKWGYLDRSGHLVVPPKYDEVLAFSEGLAAVNVGGRREKDRFEGGTWSFINPEGRPMIEEVVISASMPSSSSTSRVGTEGRQSSTAKIEAVENGFRGGKARVKIGSRLVNGESQSPSWGYIDSRGLWLAQGNTTIPLNLSSYTPGEGFTFESDVLGNRATSADALQAAEKAEDLGKALEQVEDIEKEATEQNQAAQRAEELGDKEAAAAARELAKERQNQAKSLREEVVRNGGDANSNSLKYFGQALKLYQDVAKNSQDIPLRDKAQYKLGEMHEHLTQYWDAYEAYKKFVGQASVDDQLWALAIERMFSIGNAFLAGQPQMFWKIPLPPDMNKVVEIYETIIRTAPFGPYAALATFSCGLARERQGADKLEKAVKFYEEVLDKYPKSDLIDDAQYQIGYAWMRSAMADPDPEYDQTAAQRGMEAFQDYLTTYKRGDKTDQAAENIELLKTRLGGGSMAVAQFYERAGNLTAAITYYSDVESRAPDSPLGKEAGRRKKILQGQISDLQQQGSAPDRTKISFRSNPAPQPHNLPPP